MEINKAIFKIGGKILDNSGHLINTLAQLTQLFEDNIIKKIIIIPGGGTLANYLRSLDIKFNLKNDLAHWMAIHSLDFNGIILKRKFPHLKVIDEFESIQKEDKIMAIFLPYKFLKKTDELPHSWDVTSDSITLYLAHKFNLKQCFLIKDIDGIINSNQNIVKEISTIKFNTLKENEKLASFQSNDTDLKTKSKPVDPYIFELINKYKIPCIMLNGASQELMIFNYFGTAENDVKTYTKIYPV